jgi:hypothetical protein
VNEQEKFYLIQFIKLLMKGDFQISQLAPEHKECEIWIDNPKQFNYVVEKLCNLADIKPANAMMVLRKYSPLLSNFGFTLEDGRVYYNGARVEGIKSFSFYG